MSLTKKVGPPAAGIAALGLLEHLLPKLVSKGVLTEDEVSAMLNEAADMLRQMPQALAQEAGASIRKR